MDVGSSARPTPQLRLVADALPLLISHLNADLRHLFVNRAYAVWFAMACEEMEGRTLDEVLDRRVVEALRPMIERALAGEQVEADTELPHPHHDSGVRSVRVSYTPHCAADGSVIGLVGSITDISEQKQREAERQRLLQFAQLTGGHLALLANVSERLSESLDYETTVQAIPKLGLPALGDFAFFDVIELDGQVRRITHAHADGPCSTLLRDARWEALAREHAFTLSAQCSGLHTQVEDGLLAQIASSPEHLTLLRELRLQSLITVPLSYLGRMLGALTLCFAAGDRAHSAPDLALAEELARRAGAALEYARLFQEAKQAVGIRDDFLSVAGHELRTPLTALQLQVLSIERMLKIELDVDKICARAEKAARNVVRLSTLVNELLDISRLSAGRLTLERTPFDLSEPVFEVLERMADQVVRSGCQVDMKIEGELHGHWDRLRIEQVVTNLLSNAIACGKGKPIAIRLERAGAHACLSVRDFGVGVSLQDQKRMFERFERAVPERHALGGLGLGLWIARQLVEAHGGTIRVLSVPNEGATFHVELALEAHGANASEA